MGRTAQIRGRRSNGLNFEEKPSDERKTFILKDLDDYGRLEEFEMESIDVWEPYVPDSVRTERVDRLKKRAADNPDLFLKILDYRAALKANPEKTGRFHSDFGITEADYGSEDYRDMMALSYTELEEIRAVLSVGKIDYSERTGA